MLRYAYMSTFFTRFLSFALVGSIAFASSAPHLLAASKRVTNFPETMSASDLREAYAQAAAGGDKVRILIMPGHEPDFGGAVFQGQYEREMAVSIAESLAAELRTDPNLEVLVARGNMGWNDDLEQYFDHQGRKIERFVDDHKEAYAKLEKRGRLAESAEQAAHNEARSDVALRLYGVSKWANENDVDLMLHLHLNDETSHAADVPGIHSGLAIYVPDSIYGNAKASMALAEPVFERLNETTATSTSGLETQGILEDRELIAIGAYNTAEMPSLLIEYGYIYEPRITGAGARKDVFADYAYQTALGVKDFFGARVSAPYASKALPYAFVTDVLATSTVGNPDAHGIYALQAALSHLGYYPGGESSLSVCPISGIANVCTAAALKAFQASKGLEQTGQLGPQTRVALNSAFNLATPAAAAAPDATPAPASTTTPASPAASCAFTSALALDATDAGTSGEVSRLQAFLAKDPALYPEGKVTGYFGPATLAAVKRFQLTQAIVASSSPAYGMVGPMTKAALAKACSTPAR